MIFLLKIFLYDNNLVFSDIDLSLLSEHPLNKLIAFLYIGSKLDFCFIICLFCFNFNFYFPSAQFIFLFELLVVGQSPYKKKDDIQILNIFYLFLSRITI
jgi:hypothetical protein